jgi:DNA-binding CsgD family transcriptional regulator
MLKEKSENSEDLTPRELKVLKLVCRDKTNLEIAEKISISLRSTEKVKARLYKKTGTKSSLGLFKWAITNKLVSFKF